MIDTFSPVRGAMFSGNKPGESLACKAAGGGISIGDPMTLHDFVQWCHDNELDIASTTIDHGVARIGIADALLPIGNGPEPLVLDGPEESAWGFACDFVDKFGGWARWYGADVVMRLGGGPTISIRTVCEPMSDERPRRRYPETKDLPWPPTDDEQVPPVVVTWNATHRPDCMSLTDYHGDA